MSSETIQLLAQNRSITGKQVKQLRSSGLVAANIYGNGENSMAISVDLKNAIHVVQDAGMTQVVHITVEKKDNPVIITDIHRDPLTGHLGHIDFKRVNLNKKMEAQVPLQIIGEAEGIALHNAELNVLHHEITIEAFPADVPTHIDVDVTKLVELTDEITIADIPSHKDIKILHEPELVLVKLHAHVEQSTEPEIESEAVPAGENESSEEESATPEQNEA